MSRGETIIGSSKEINLGIIEGHRFRAVLVEANFGPLDPSRMIG